MRDLARGMPIEFLPWQDDIGPVLRQLDVVVLSSAPIDATPRVIMEAFSASVPVVAYPSPGIAELIEHGSNGLLTNARTPESLAATIVELLADPERMERLGRQARRAYESRFTVERFRAEVIGVLEGL